MNFHSALSNNPITETKELKSFLPYLGAKKISRSIVPFGPSFPKQKGKASTFPSSHVQSLDIHTLTIPRMANRE